MKVSPLAAGQGVNTPTVNVEAQNAARSKAIAMLTGNNQQPVPNASNISPEEMMAVRRPTSQPEKKPSLEDVANAGQDDLQATSEETSQEETTSEQEETPAEETPKKDPLSSQYALLARKEKALRAKAQQQEQSFRAREEALKAKEAELGTKSNVDMSRYIDKEALKANPLKALLEAGSSYEELVNQVVNRPQVDPATEVMMNELRAQIQELKNESKTNQENMTKQQQQAYDAALNQIRQDARKLIANDPAYETVKATNSLSDVVELIEATFKETGEVLSVEDAAQQVEDYLIEEALKLAKLSKIQKRMQPVSAKPAASNAQTPQGQLKQTQPMKTLTNAAGSTRQLSARERAIAAMEGRLKA